MKTENEKDFLKHFEKFLIGVNKSDLSVRAINRESDINAKLHDDLENDFERIFFRNSMLVKHGKSLLENIKNLKILYYESISLTDSINTIIDGIKSSAEKIADKNKKEIAMKIAPLLKKRCSLLKKKDQNVIKFLGFHEIIGKYAIKCGNKMMSIRNFKKEYSDFRDIASINYDEVQDYSKK